jgi:predicted methyltransferase
LAEYPLTYYLANIVRRTVLFMTRATKGIDPDKVVFSCLGGRSYGDNTRIISERLHERCPGAKIVWASSTPLNATDSRARKVAALNAAARRAAESVGDVAENDLYALANPLDRKAYWVDTHHYTSDGYELLASQVVEKITAPMATSRDGGTD